jgi:hypothetical protein
MAVSPTGAALARRNAALPLDARLAALVRPGARLGVYADLLLAVSLLVVAGLVRWQNLLISPQFSSGGTAIPMALDIADGRAFYLREVSPYIGGPYIWLLALVYKLFGSSVEATMLVTWAIGALTIVPTYLLGREVGGRLVGLLAAALLATSGAHTVITSHVPISHSLTPLISTTVLWLLVRAVRQATPSDVAARSDPTALTRGGRLLALAGFLAGLTLQTHPTAAPLLAGAGAGALLMRPAWLRTRWPAIAVGMAVLGYSTLLAYHVSSGFEIISDIQTKQGRYLDAGHDVETGPRTALYPSNLGALLLSSARLMSGTLDEREEPADFLDDPWVLAPAALALVGLAVGVHRRAWWLVGTVLLAVFLPPAFNGKYRPILDGRFLMPLLPVLFVALGLAISGAGSVVSAGLSNGSSASVRSRRFAQMVAVSVLVLGSTALVVHPLIQLNAYYDSSIEDGFSNTLYLQTLRQLQAARRDDEAVLLDPQLLQVKSLGGGKAWTSFVWLLAVSRLPSESLDDVSASSGLIGRLAILQRDTADRLDDALLLEPLDGRKLSGRDRASYRAYRIVGPAASK